MLDITIEDRVAIAKLDDGKANAVGFAFVEAVNEALDRALADAGAVAFFGREGRFCAGFDLSVIREPGEQSARVG